MECEVRRSWAAAVLLALVAASAAVPAEAGENTLKAEDWTAPNGLERGLGLLPRGPWVTGNGDLRGTVGIGSGPPRDDRVIVERHAPGMSGRPQPRAENRPAEEDPHQ
jgi:hypothetical protein